MESTYIYSLSNPINNEVRYIGKSMEPEHVGVQHQNIKDKNILTCTRKKIWL